MDKLVHRREDLEVMKQGIERRSQQEDANRKALGQRERFCEPMKTGWENLTFAECQQFLWLVVGGITVFDGQVRVEIVIPTDRDVQLRNSRGEFA